MNFFRSGHTVRRHFVSNSSMLFIEIISPTIWRVTHFYVQLDISAQYPWAMELILHGDVHLSEQKRLVIVSLVPRRGSKVQLYSSFQDAGHSRIMKSNRKLLIVPLEVNYITRSSIFIKSTVGLYRCVCVGVYLSALLWRLFLGYFQFFFIL